jgi:hypothetical protein
MEPTPLPAVVVVKVNCRSPPDCTAMATVVEAPPIESTSGAALALATLAGTWAST